MFRSVRSSTPPAPENGPISSGGAGPGRADSIASGGTAANRNSLTDYYGHRSPTTETTPEKPLPTAGNGGAHRSQSYRSGHTHRANGNTTTVASANRHPSPESIANSERPGTAGTEQLLTAARMRAAEQLERARKAEKEYRQHKRVTGAKRDLADMRLHWRAMARHLRQAVSATWATIKVWHILFAERRREKARKAAGLQVKQQESRLQRERSRDSASLGASTFSPGGSRVASGSHAGVLESVNEKGA